MQVFKVPEAGGQAARVAGQVGDLVQAIGRPDFVGRLLRGLQQVGSPEYVSIFAFPSADRPVFVGTDCVSMPLLASRAAEQYLGRHYRDDPNREMLFGEAGSAGEMHATYMRREDVPTANYRLMCYDRAQITDRFSILTRTGAGQPLSISFYRSIGSGMFAAADLAALLDFAPIVCATVIRHLQLGGAPGSADCATMLAALRERFPALSRREAEVAAGAVTGMQGQEIAEWLGIGLTSVISHRNAAYKRLGVNGLRGLMLLVYAH